MRRRTIPMEEQVQRKVTMTLLLKRGERVQMVVNFSDLIKER